MADAMHFEAHAEGYGRARPPYPPALWNRLRELGFLAPGTRVLELGAGSGQATGPLLTAGLDVTAVEPGPRLASLLRAAFPAASVVVARAEEVDLDRQSFDVAVAATSIHWMDLAVVVPTVHQLLRPGGSFLVWRNVFGDPDAPVTPFRARLAQIDSLRTRPARPGPDAEDPAVARASLTRAGLFTAEETANFRWTLELDEDQVRRLFSTFSDWTVDEVEEAAAAARDLGGTVVEHYKSWLLVLRREAGPAG